MTFLVTVPLGKVEEVLRYLGSISKVVVTLCASMKKAPIKEVQMGEEALLVNVEDFKLSPRTKSCLKNAKIQTIGDLVQKTEPEMLRIKCFGRKCLAEIKEILEGMDLSLKQ